MVTFTSPAITDISPQGMTVLIWAAPFHLNHLPERRIRNGFCAEAGSLPVQTRIPTFSIRMKKTGNMQISAFPCGSAQKKETLTAKTLASWVSTENHEVSMNSDSCLAYVKTLAEKYDTQGHPRQFTTSGGSTITLSKGDFGWKLDEEKMTQLLLSEAQASDVSRFITPVWSHKGVSFEAGNDIGDSYVEIDLTNQKVWLYKDGKKPGCHRMCHRHLRNRPPDTGWCLFHLLPPVPSCTPRSGLCFPCPVLDGIQRRHRTARCELAQHIRR